MFFCSSLKVFIRPAFGFLVLMVFSNATFSAERGSPVEAQAMVQAGINTFNDLGPDGAIKAFHEGSAIFKNKDLYIFMIDPQGTVVAQANNPKRAGLDVTKIKDVTGAPYGLNLYEGATAAGIWVDYKRKDPLTNQILSKSSWARRHKGYVFGVGVYKSE